MVQEIARLSIKTGMERDFELAVESLKPRFLAAPGCTAVELQRIVEKPGQYFLFVWWNHVDDHMVHFRNSPDFALWRATVGPMFDGAPEMVHGETV